MITNSSNLQLCISPSKLVAVCGNQVWMSSMARSFWRRGQDVLCRWQYLLPAGDCGNNNDDLICKWKIILYDYHKVMDKIRSKKVVPECQCKKDCVGWEYDLFRSARTSCRTFDFPTRPSATIFPEFIYTGIHALWIIRSLIKPTRWHKGIP